MAGEGHDVDTVAAAYGNTNEEAKARAALIVRAVNSHEKLVEACENARKHISTYGGKGCKIVLCTLLAALAQAHQ